ncbi:hypothetical protein NL30_25340 [Burkholderia contaminans]|nr:hypothetical protein NL30_25340 [Burkholderia contaminans]
MRTIPANVLSPAVARATISNGAPALTTPLHAFSPERRRWVDDSPVSMDSSSSASSVNVPSTESQLEGTYLGGYFVVTQLALLGLVFALKKLDWRALVNERRLTFGRGHHPRGSE